MNVEALKTVEEEVRQAGGCASLTLRLSGRDTWLT